MGGSPDFSLRGPVSKNFYLVQHIVQKKEQWFRMPEFAGFIPVITFLATLPQPMPSL
jgi:hypothetical protein